MGEHFPICHSVRATVIKVAERSLSATLLRETFLATQKCGVLGDSSDSSPVAQTDVTALEKDVATGTEMRVPWKGLPAWG